MRTLPARTGKLTNGMIVALLKRTDYEFGSDAEVVVLEPWTYKSGITTLHHEPGDRLHTNLTNYLPDAE